MDDPILTAIAVALSTRAVEGLTDAGREALASLMHLVRRKATGHRELRASLVAEPTSPEGDDRAVELHRALAPPPVIRTSTRSYAAAGRPSNRRPYGPTR